MRILFVSANPHWTARLDLADELRTMQKSLGRFGAKITLLPAAQLEDLEKAIDDDNFDVVHFSGHATKDKGLLFRKPNGEPAYVDKHKLAAILKRSDRRIKLAVLNACNTDATVEGIKEVVDASIGTDDVLDDRAAKLMTRILYSELTKEGKERPVTVKDAYDEAKRIIVDNEFDNVYHPKLKQKDPKAEITIERTRLAEDEDPVQGRTEYDRYFFSSYLGEQISVLNRNIRLNKYALWALVVLGFGMLMFDWGQHIYQQKPYGEWGVLGQVGSDVWDFMRMALASALGQATDSERGTPFLDWLLQLGQITPLAIAAMQYRWCVHGLARKREMAALKELVDGSADLTDDVMTRLHGILDQSLKVADVEFRDLREFLPEPIKESTDRLLDRVLGENIERTPKTGAPASSE